MKPVFEVIPEHTRLFAGWCDEALVPEQLVALQELLRSNSPARHAFIAYMDAHADFHFRMGRPTVLNELVAKGVVPVERGMLRPRRRIANWVGLAAAASLLLATAGWIWLGSSNPAKLARVTDVHGIDPASAEKLFAIGAQLGAQPLELPQGILDITTTGGTQLRIAGPAEFKLATASEVELTRGRLVALVPVNDHGFAVRTPHGKIIDLGTEFACEVVRSGDCNVQVLTGKVAIELNTQQGSAVTSLPSVRAGEGRRIAKHAIEVIPFDGAEFAVALRNKQSHPPVEVAEVAATPEANTAVVAKRATKPPLLRDDQKISAWEWDKFRWQPVDGDVIRPVTFAITVPPGHKYVTVAVDDEKGVRVRNLLDAIEVTKLGGDPNANEAQVLSVEWNGLDDDGNPLPDGTYRIRGCSHPGMKLVYEYSFLNPGTPPWEHYPNSGWGGDHGFPHAIACLRGHRDGPWRVATGGTTAEGGSPGFVLGGEDRKVYAFGRGWAGPKAMAASDGLLWIALSGGKDVQRIEYHTGKNVPFKTPQGPQSLLTFDEDAWGIAVGAKRAAVLLRNEQSPQKERVMLFDKDSGENRVEIPLGTPGRRNGMAFAQDGKTLYVSTDEGLISLATAEPKPAPKPVKFGDIEKPGPLATDKDGNLFIMDRGADYRVKVFSPNGALLREIGVQKGQGERLEFDPAALHGVEAISVDDDGCLWAAEQGETDKRPGTGFVRRIAVWKGDGTFLKDFVGTTWYAANNTCLHQQDPTLAYGYGVIYKLEPGKKPGYRPLRYVTTAQPADAPFWLWTGSPGTLFGSARMFRSDISGTMREYLLQANGLPILFQANDKNEYRPILAIGSHEHNAAFPQVKDEPKALFLWTDRNGDARPQPNEFQRLPGSTYKADLGCGYPPSNELVWYVEGIELKPKSFTPEGVPEYDVATAKRLPIPQHYLPVGKHLFAGLGGKFNSLRDGVYASGQHLFTDRDGNLTAKYRCNWGGVHASWSSTPGYTPGQTGRSIGELHYAGIVEANKDLGHVIAIQGNYGQSFIWSEDGLFVTPLFKDSRQNPQGWGAKEEFGADWTDVTMYGECFGGMMARQEDGKVRYLFGRNGCHVVRVEGLEAVQPFNAGTVELKGTTATGKPAPTPQSPDQTLWVPNVKGRFPAFNADGDFAEWKDVPRREIKNGDGQVVARIAVAHSMDQLWILAEVEDPSPWKNAGIEPKLAFKTGDAIDISLGPERPNAEIPINGDVRVLIAPSAEKPIVMAYRPVKPDAKPDEAMKFESPVKTHQFASVVPIGDAQVAFKETKTGYIIEARLACDQIGLQNARNGMHLRGDLGVLWGNEAGLVTERRIYLFNRGPAVAVVSDTPTEAELTPKEWGAWILE